MSVVLTFQFYPFVISFSSCFSRMDDMPKCSIFRANQVGNQNEIENSSHTHALKLHFLISPPFLCWPIGTYTIYKVGCVWWDIGYRECDKYHCE